MKTGISSSVTISLIVATSVVVFSFQNCSAPKSNGVTNSSSRPSNGSTPGSSSTSLSQSIVATIYSETDHVTNKSSCATASDPAAAAAGYWDLGQFSSCDANGTPQCRNGAKKLVVSQTEYSVGASQKTKYHTACVLPNSSEGFQIVATIYSQSDLATSTNTCATASDPAAAAAGYWDLGQFSSCDSSNIPRCANGSNKIVLAATMVPGTSVVKYHTACVRNSATDKSRFVATIYSEESSTGNSCATAQNSVAANAGYWDLGSGLNGPYSSCDAQNRPQCAKGSQKVITSMTIDSSGQKIKYHTACVLPAEQDGSEIVATIYSSESSSGNACAPASDSAASAAGYWDLGQYGTCGGDGLPICADGSRKLLLSSTSTQSGTVRYHSACVNP